MLNAADVPHLLLLFKNQKSMEAKPSATTYEDCSSTLTSKGSRIARWRSSTVWKRTPPTVFAVAGNTLQGNAEDQGQRNCVQKQSTSFLLQSKIGRTWHYKKWSLIKTFLETQKNVVVSTSTIARKLEGQLVTLKKLELVPERRNCLENREARRRHAQWLQGAHEQGARFCFVDECGYNLYTARTRGRSVKGLPARKVVENQRTPHITIMCAVCPGIGLMHNATIVGGAKQEQFDNFVRALVSRDFGQPMVPHHDTNKRYIIYDNAPCHRGVEERLADSVPEDLELVRLPPYSCPLNPIEYCFQSVKAHIKRSLSQHGPVLPEEGQTLVAARRQLLVNLIPESLTEITHLSCLNSFYHVLTVTAPAALRLENLWHSKIHP